MTDWSALLPIFLVDVSLVAADQICAHICPPDGKRRIDQDAELFSFDPSLKGARALNADAVSLLRRGKIELMQKATRPLHSAGIHKNLMFVSAAFAALMEETAPGRHQFVPLDAVYFNGASAPSPGVYLAALVMDHAPTVDLERSSILRTYLPHLDKTAIRLSAVFPEERVVFKDTAAGRNLWADGAIFCTDQFRRRANALDGRLGLAFGACTEI